MRTFALCLVLLAAVPASAQVAAPTVGGAFGSGLSGPPQNVGPAPQLQVAPPPPRAGNLDLFGVPFTQAEPGGGLPYTPPQVYGAGGVRRR